MNPAGFNPIGLIDVPPYALPLPAFEPPPPALMTIEELRELPPFADEVAIPDAALAGASIFATEILRRTLDRGITYGVRQMRILELPASGWLRLADAPVAAMLAPDGLGGWLEVVGVTVAQGPGYLAIEPMPAGGVVLGQVLTYASGYAPLPPLLVEIFLDLTRGRISSWSSGGIPIESITVPDVGSIKFAVPGAASADGSITSASPTSVYDGVLGTYRRPSA